jgi:hypothetical protein
LVNELISSGTGKAFIIGMPGGRSASASQKLGAAGEALGPAW